MIENIGKFLDDNGLTLEEEAFLGNVAEIEICDLCGMYFGIINHHENDIFIEYNGRQFLCNKCRQ